MTEDLGESVKKINNDKSHNDYKPVELMPNSNENKMECDQDDFWQEDPMDVAKEDKKQQAGAETQGNVPTDSRIRPEPVIMITNSSATLFEAIDDNQHNALLDLLHGDVNRLRRVISEDNEDRRVTYPSINIRNRRM